MKLVMILQGKVLIIINENILTYRSRNFTGDPGKAIDKLKWKPLEKCKDWKG